MRHTVEFAFKCDSQGLGKGGTGTIKIDGVETGSGTFSHTMPFAPESSETFDVGSDTGTGVDDEDYQTPFAFDGKLDTRGCLSDSARTSKGGLMLEGL